MIGLSRQLDCVICFIQGARDRLAIVEAKDKWPAAEIERHRMRIDELHAVAVTLSWLIENEAAIKQRLAG